MNLRRQLGALAAVTLALTAVAAPAQSAKPGKPATTLQLSGVSATAKPVAVGMQVTATFTAKNRTGKRQGATQVWVYLTNADHTYRLGTGKTPAMAPGADSAVKVVRTTPPRTAQGSYAVRVCLTPRPTGPCATSKRADVDVTAAELAADPAVLGLPDTERGSSSEPMTVVISNDGHARTGTAVGLALDGPDATEFEVEAGSCDTWLAAGAACAALVTFSPDGSRGTPGPRSAVLRVTSGPADRAVAIDLVGLATAPANPVTIVPGAHDYGAVPVGATATYTYELTNSSDTDLPLTAGDLSDYTSFVFDYVDGENTCLSNVIPANGSCTFSVAFAPVAAGPATTTAEFGSGTFLGTATLTGVGTTTPVRSAPVRPHAGDYALR